MKKRRKCFWSRIAALGLMGCMVLGGFVPGSAEKVQAAIVDGNELVDGLSREEGYLILPESSEKELTFEDISWLSASKRQMAVNEIYARHGRKFVIPEVQEYFNEKYWYSGTVEAKDFDENVLSSIEAKNIVKLLQTSHSSSYVLEGSNTRYVTDEEVALLTKDDLQLAINEIYARHGRIFTMKQYSDYFNSQSWYKGTVEASKFDESVFNNFENTNIRKLSERMKAVEQAQKQSAIPFAGAYVLEGSGIEVRLEISVYTSPSLDSAEIGQEIGTITTEIDMGDGEIMVSDGYLQKEALNVYTISGTDLSGASLTAFDDCVILLGSCGFDDVYQLVERYTS